MSKALQHCGYECKDFEDGVCTITLSTPFEGATIRARLSPALPSQGCEEGREWWFLLQVRNNRGIGWSVRGTFSDCGRYVAKGMLRSMALEMRRAYTHRGQKIRKRAIARAKAKAAQEGDAPDETKTI